MILTPHMRLIPATAALVRAEIAQPDTFAAMLDAEVPDNWPPEMLSDALPWFLQQLEQTPDLCGWLAWYGLDRTDQAVRSRLVASGGFLGRPQQGMLEVGYSVLPQFQRQGFAREMLTGVLQWAFAQADVVGVFADIHQSNTPSLRLVRSLDFINSGSGREPGYERFQMMVSNWKAQ
jgi:[ribosomal protein S5]-alanine N-acetyltransferase